MAKMTKAKCESDGLNWNEDTGKCELPKIGLIKMTVSRGSGCNGGHTRVEEIRKRLPEATRRVLLKAAIKRRK